MSRRLRFLLCVGILLDLFLFGRLAVFHVTAPGKPAHSLIRVELPGDTAFGVYVAPAQRGQRGFVELWAARAHAPFYDRLLRLPGAPALPRGGIQASRSPALAIAWLTT